MDWPPCFSQGTIFFISKNKYNQQQWIVDRLSLNTLELQGGHGSLGTFNPHFQDNFILTDQLMCRFGTLVFDILCLLNSDKLAILKDGKSPYITHVRRLLVKLLTQLEDFCHVFQSG